MMVAILTFCVSSVLADSITVIILVPLTINICRLLKLNPVPYVIVLAIFTKLGATVLPISSIPSIIITSAQDISFIEYFTTAGLISIAIAGASIIVLLLFYRAKLPAEKPKGLSIFIEYNPWVFVVDRRMMLISSGTFLGVILALIMIPNTVLRPDSIAFIGAAFLFFVNRKNAEEILKEIDFKLILYLLGVFTITGGLDYVGFIDLIGNNLTELGITDIGLAFMALLWISAIASAFIDNIPITQLLLSLINILMGAKGTPIAKFGSLGLAVGVIWGDNFTPSGDSILALNVAKQNKVEIAPKEFWKVGFSLAVFQFTLISLVILLLFDPIIGIPLGVS